MKDLLLGFIANRAGVVQHQVSRFDTFYLPVSLLNQRADHLLGVMHVHLAAEGFKVERLLCGRHQPQYSQKSKRQGPEGKPGSGTSSRTSAVPYCDLHVYSRGDSGLQVGTWPGVQGAPAFSISSSSFFRSTSTSWRSLPICSPNCCAAMLKESMWV